MNLIKKRIILDAALLITTLLLIIATILIIPIYFEALFSVLFQHLTLFTIWLKINMYWLLATSVLLIIITTFFKTNIYVKLTINNVFKYIIIAAVYFTWTKFTEFHNITECSGGKYNTNLFCLYTIFFSIYFILKLVDIAGRQTNYYKNHLIKQEKLRKEKELDIIRTEFSKKMWHHE
jgi:hypothetical protein